MIGILYTVASREKQASPILIDRLYPFEFGIKDTSDITKSASYFDLHHEIDSEDFTTKETLSK
jgi:hypothetical protein